MEPKSNILQCPAERRPETARPPVGQNFDAGKGSDSRGDLRHPATPIPGKSRPDRIYAYDVARAVAVIGMILVNCHSILLTGENRHAWYIKTVDFLYGRPAALFVMLAGVGLVMVSRRAIADGNADRLFEIRFSLVRRSMALFLMGWMFSFVWNTDILHFYGMYLCIGAILLRVSGRFLWGLAAVVLLVSAAVYIDSGGDPSLGLYISDVAPLTLLLDDLIAGGTYAALPWLVFLFLGMWIGKCDKESSPTFWRSTIAIGIVIALAAETLSMLVMEPPLKAIHPDVWDLLAFSASFPVTPLFAVSAAAGNAALIGAFRIGIRNRSTTRWLSPLRSTGQLSMTIYIAHILVVMGVERWIGHTGGTAAYRVAAFVTTISTVILSISFSHWWLRSHARGPLEQAFRWISASEYAGKKEERIPISA